MMRQAKVARGRSHGFGLMTRAWTQAMIHRRDVDCGAGTPPPAPACDEVHEGGAVGAARHCQKYDVTALQPRKKRGSFLVSNDSRGVHAGKLAYRGMGP